MAARMRGVQQLMLRSQIGGDRTTALTAISLLCKAVFAIDLSDNMITDDEVAVILNALNSERAASVANLAGNRLTFKGVSKIAESLLASDSTSHLSELDLSRNQMCQAATDGQPSAAPRALKAVSEGMFALGRA
eukprot:469746-Prymnesium_polylepis.1